MEFKQVFAIQNEWGKYLLVFTMGSQFNDIPFRYRWIEEWEKRYSIFKSEDKAKKMLKNIDRQGTYKIVKLYILN